MKRLTRHEQMVFIFGCDLVNSGMESRGKSKLPLNCAGDGKGVGRTPFGLKAVGMPIKILNDSLEGLGRVKR